jgi:hypothetical protein
MEFEKSSFADRLLFDLAQQREVFFLKASSYREDVSIGPLDFSLTEPERGADELLAKLGFNLDLLASSQDIEKSPYLFPTRKGDVEDHDVFFDLGWNFKPGADEDNGLGAFAQISDLIPHRAPDVRRLDVRVQVLEYKKSRLLDRADGFQRLFRGFSVGEKFAMKHSESCGVAPSIEGQLALFAEALETSLDTRLLVGEQPNERESRGDKFLEFL